MTTESTAGSSAQGPDLDWSQIRETILMLALSVAQIEISMRDSDGSVEVLSNSFTSMMAQMKLIEQTTVGLPDMEGVTSAKMALLGNCEAVSGMMRNAIMAFQFYDKLTQRLGHVNSSLSALADLVSDQRRLYNPYEWKGMQTKIKSRYSMEEERLMFEAVMMGKTVKQALAIYIKAMEERKQKALAAGANTDDDEEVELF